jgi:hypothetical protein
MYIIINCIFTLIDIIGCYELEKRHKTNHIYTFTAVTSYIKEKNKKIESVIKKFGQIKAKKVCSICLLFLSQ